MDAPPRYGHRPFVPAVDLLHVRGVDALRLTGAGMGEWGSKTRRGAQRSISYYPKVEHKKEKCGETSIVLDWCISRI